LPTSGEEYEVVQGWDLALTTDKRKAEVGDTDYSVGITLARRVSDGHVFVVSIVRFRGKTPDGVRRAVEVEYERWATTPPTRVIIEQNNFGALHLLALQAGNVTMPLVGHTTTHKKNDPLSGLPSLAAAFECHRITLASGGAARAIIGELSQELAGYGMSRHDDMVMALYIAFSGFRRGLGRTNYVVDLFDSEEEIGDNQESGMDDADEDPVSVMWESIREWD